MSRPIPVLPRFTHVSVLALVAALTQSAIAAPDGGVIRGGAGTIDQAGSNTVIQQASEQLAIDWQTFNIAADERVEFIQPSSSALALNRVVSNDPTTILGTISANGHVLLVNPNGVFIGETARVDVGGLVASGLDIDPDEFMAAQRNLTTRGSGGPVVNSGLITAATGGNVVLLGEQVTHTGRIAAQLGTVTLAAGRAAVLTFDANQRIGVRINENLLSDKLEGEPAILTSEKDEINTVG